MKKLGNLLALFLAAMLGALAAPVIPTIANVFTGFEITDRGILTYGVPFVRSGAEYGNNQPTAFDVGPRGNPADNGGSGKAWIDVCNADLIANQSAPVTCVYSGAWGGQMQLGTRSFNGAAEMPLKLRIGDKIVGELNANGLIIYGTVTANAFVGAQPPEDGVENFAGGGQFRAIPPTPFGTGDFTYAFWVNTAQTSRADVLTQANSYLDPNWHGLLLNVSASGQMQWYENSTAKLSASATGFNDGQWYHVAITRAAGNLRMFLDGQQKGVSVASTFSYGNASTGLRLGAPSYAGGGSFVGKVDDFTIANTAMWTANFTPPARSN